MPVEKEIKFVYRMQEAKVRMAPEFNFGAIYAVMHPKTSHQQLPPDTWQHKRRKEL